MRVWRAPLVRRGGSTLHACGTQEPRRVPLLLPIEPYQPLSFSPTGVQRPALGWCGALYAASSLPKTNCFWLALEPGQGGIAPTKAQMRGNVLSSREGPHSDGQLPDDRCSPVPRARERKLGLVWYRNRLFPRPQLLPQVAKHFPNCEQEGYTFFLS